MPCCDEMLKVKTKLNKFKRNINKMCSCLFNIIGAIVTRLNTGVIT